jgi:hypothetical protein
MKPLLGEIVVIGLDGAHVLAVAARVARSTLEILGWVGVQRPADVSSDDATAVGRWLGEELRRGGLTGRRAILAMGRSEVVLKTLQLPGAAKAEEPDLLSMVRLQLTRQLSMSLDGAAMDFLVQERGSSGDATILAGAMPKERLDWCRALAAGAHLKLERIALRAFGTATIMGLTSKRQHGALVGVACGDETTEIVVLEHGQFAFARSIDLGGAAAGDPEATSDRVATEVRRSWMSHRAGKAGGEPEGVLALGDGPLASSIAIKCGSLLGCPGEVAGMPSGVSGEGFARGVPDGVLPLVGLMLEHAQSRVTLNFAGVRRVADTQARKRQLAMASILAGIVLVGGGLSLAKTRLGRLEDELATLQGKIDEQSKQRDKFAAEHARLSHIENWNAARVDWLAHVRRLSDEMPSPRDAPLDGVSGELSVGEAGYRPKDSTIAYPNGTWEPRRLAQISLSGKTSRRDVATELRGRLVSGALGAIYEVNTRGADLPDRFSLDLSTTLATPEVATAKPAGSPAKSTPPTAATPGAAPESPAKKEGGK